MSVIGRKKIETVVPAWPAPSDPAAVSRVLQSRLFSWLCGGHTRYSWRLRGGHTSHLCPWNSLDSRLQTVRLSDSRLSNCQTPDCQTARLSVFSFSLSCWQSGSWHKEIVLKIWDWKAKSSKLGFAFQINSCSTTITSTWSYKKVLTHMKLGHLVCGKFCSIDSHTPGVLFS